MERITDKYVFFWGSELSNWYSAFFTYKNHNFANSEQAFMWEKAVTFKDNESADMILHTPSPMSNKQLGRKVKNFDAKVWSEVSYQIMVDVNMAKFSQNPRLAKLLLSTENKTIVEASPDDCIWGIGLYWSNNDCLDESKWKGTNWLGKALMDVREKLRNETNK